MRKLPALIASIVLAGGVVLAGGTAASAAPQSGPSAVAQVKTAPIKSACSIQNGYSYASATNCGRSWRVRIVCSQTSMHSYLAYSPWSSGRDQAAAYCQGNTRRTATFIETR